MCKAKTIKVTRAIANKDEKRREEENVHDGLTCGAFEQLFWNWISLF